MNSKREFDLSIIIPMHNREHCIERTLNSIACQVNEEVQIEIILIDDKSSDNSVAIAKKWAEKSAVELVLLENEEQIYAFRSRLRGVEHARSHDIMFVDDDDRVLGDAKDLRLIRMIRRKQARNCDILHCHSRYMAPQGRYIGEFYSYPLDTSDTEDGLLTQPEIFNRYSQRFYFPVTLWGKIYSKSLIEEVLPYTKIQDFPRLEDKFLTTLLMLHAKSYEASEEYIYLYNFFAGFSINKYAKRALCLLDAWRIIQVAMQKKNIAKETQDNIENFFHRRIVPNTGNFTSMAEEEFFKSYENPKNIIEKAGLNLEDKDLFACLLLSFTNNTHAIMKKLRRIDSEY